MLLSDPLGDGNGIISGYNCRHRLIPYEPGSNPPNDYTEAKIKREYTLDRKLTGYEKDYSNNNLTDKEKIEIAYKSNLNYMKLIDNAVKVDYNRFIKLNSSIEKPTGATTKLTEDEKAENMYNLFRKRKDDVPKIADRLKLSVEIVQMVKNYMFIDSHDLDLNGFRPFFGDMDIARACQQLADKNMPIKDSSIILIKHELFEISLIKKGFTQSKAHMIVGLRYNFNSAVEEEKKMKKEVKDGSNTKNKLG